MLRWPARCLPRRKPSTELLTSHVRRYEESDEEDDLDEDEEEEEEVDEEDEEEEGTTALFYHSLRKIDSPRHPIVMFRFLSNHLSPNDIPMLLIVR